MKTTFPNWEAFRQTMTDDHRRFNHYVVGFAVEKMAPNLCGAILTLVTTGGSPPHPIGAQMTTAETGEWMGCASRGWLERAIVSEALDGLHVGNSRFVHYGKGACYFELQLPCGFSANLVFVVTQDAPALAAWTAEFLVECRLGWILLYPSTPTPPFTFSVPPLTDGPDWGDR